VDDANGANAMGGVGAQRRFDRRGISAAPPIGVEDDRLEAEPRRHFVPQRRKPAGADHKDCVARRQRVDQRGLPGAGARGGKDDHRPIRPEYALQAGQRRAAEIGEARPAMIDRRLGDGAQHASGNVGRTGNLEKVAARRAGVHASIL
jgi:hypothetical protein